MLGGGKGKLRLGVGSRRPQSLCVLSPPLWQAHFLFSSFHTNAPKLKCGKHRSLQELYPIITEQLDERSMFPPGNKAVKSIKGFKRQLEWGLPSHSNLWIELTFWVMSVGCMNGRSYDRGWSSWGPQKFPSQWTQQWLGNTTMAQSCL